MARARPRLPSAASAVRRRPSTVGQSGLLLGEVERGEGQRVVGLGAGAGDAAPTRRARARDVAREAERVDAAARRRRDRTAASSPAWSAAFCARCAACSSSRFAVGELGIVGREEADVEPVDVGLGGREARQVGGRPGIALRRARSPCRTSPSPARGRRRPGSSPPRRGARRCARRPAPRLGRPLRDEHLPAHRHEGERRHADEDGGHDPARGAAAPRRGGLREPRLEEILVGVGVADHARGGREGRHARRVLVLRRKIEVVVRRAPRRRRAAPEARPGTGRRGALGRPARRRARTSPPAPAARTFTGSSTWPIWNGAVGAETSSRAGAPGAWPERGSARVVSSKNASSSTSASARAESAGRRPAPRRRRGGGPPRRAARAAAAARRGGRGGGRLLRVARERDGDRRVRGARRWSDAEALRRGRARARRPPPGLRPGSIRPPLGGGCPVVAGDDRRPGAEAEGGGVRGARARHAREEGLELGDEPEASRAGAAARQDVVARDHGLRDGRLQLAQGAELELPPVDGADQPALGRAEGLGPAHLELVAAVGALDRGSALRDEGVVELVRGAATLAGNVHLPSELRWEAERGG